MPKHCMEVYNTLIQDCTTLEIYHTSDYFTLFFVSQQMLKEPAYFFQSRTKVGLDVAFT